MPLYLRPLQQDPFTAPSGQWQNSANLLSAASGQAVASGIAYFQPIDVGPAAKTFDTIGMYVNTAQAGGTTTTTLGVYRDDGTGGQPYLVGGPLYSGTVLLTSTGARTVSVTMPLSVGRYWMAFLYFASAAPTTAPLTNNVSNASPALWLSNGQTIGTASRGLSVSGVTALPTTQVALTSVSTSGMPAMALRAL